MASPPESTPMTRFSTLHGGRPGLPPRPPACLQYVPHGERWRARRAVELAGSASATIPSTNTTRAPLPRSIDRLLRRGTECASAVRRCPPVDGAAPDALGGRARRWVRDVVHVGVRRPARERRRRSRRHAVADFDVLRDIDGTPDEV